MSLVKKSQVLFGLASGESLEATLTATNLLEVVSTDYPIVKVTAAPVERMLATGGPGRKPGIAGGQEGALTLVFEVAPHKSAFTEPRWFDALAACGMRKVVAKKHNIHASVWTSGTKIPHGSTFVADDSDAAGRVIGTWYKGSDTFFVYEPIGTQAITGADSTLTVTYGGSTVAVVDLADAGTIANCVAAHPSVTRTVKISHGSVTSGPINPGDELLGDSSGARGRCANPDAVNAAGALQIELYNGSPAFTNGEDISVVGGSATVTASSAQSQSFIPAATIHTLTDGHRRKLIGARGTWSILAVNKERVLLTCNFTGVPVQPDDAAMYSWQGNYRGGTPPKVIGSAFTVDGTFTPRFQQLQWSANATVTLREESFHSSGSGYCHADLTDYDHQFTMDPETVPDSVYDWWTKHFAKTDRPRSRFVWGSGSFGTFEIRNDQLEPSTFDPTDRNQRLVDSLGFNCTTDDDYVSGGETVILHY